MNQNIDLGTIFSTLKEDITELVNVKVQLIKLEVFEKTSTTSGAVIFGILMLNVVCFTLLFAFVALGLWLGELINSMPGGFALVVLLYLIILGVMVAMRKSIMAGIANMILKEMDPEIEEELKEEDRKEKVRQARAEAKQRAAANYSSGGSFSRRQDGTPVEEEIIIVKKED